MKIRNGIPIIILVVLLSFTVYAQQEVSIADEHPEDVTTALIWVIGALSGALMLLVSFVANLILKRFDRIEDAIHHLTHGVEDDISAIRNKVQEIDARVTTVETKVDMYYGNGN